MCCRANGSLTTEQFQFKSICKDRLLTSVGTFELKLFSNFYSHAVKVVFGSLNVHIIFNSFVYYIFIHLDLHVYKHV
jgi:hypothetical protein